MSEDLQPSETLTATVWRILGSELQPRDTPGRRLEILEHILSEEGRLPGAQKWYLVNRIIDPCQHRDIVELLDRYDAKYITIPYDYRLPARKDIYLQQGIFLNNARNTAIRYGLAAANWALILDGDCLLTADSWKDILAEMRDESSPYQYLSIPHRRYGQNRQGEPMVAFCRGSRERFNEFLPFGQQDKLELLYRLGHEKTPGSGHLKVVEGNRTKLVGEVLHLATGEEQAEAKFTFRSALRERSIDWAIAQLHGLPLMEYRLQNVPPGEPGWGEQESTVDQLTAGIVRDVSDGGRIAVVGGSLSAQVNRLARAQQASGKRISVTHVLQGVDQRRIEKQWTLPEQDLYWTSQSFPETDEAVVAGSEQDSQSAAGDAADDAWADDDQFWSSQSAPDERPSVSAPTPYIPLPPTDGYISYEKQYCYSLSRAAKEFPDRSLDVLILSLRKATRQETEHLLSRWYPKLKPGGLLLGDGPILQSAPNGEVFSESFQVVLEFFRGSSLEVRHQRFVWSHVRPVSFERRARTRQWG